MGLKISHRIEVGNENKNTIFLIKAFFGRIFFPSLEDCLFGGNWDPEEFSEFLKIAKQNQGCNVAFVLCYKKNLALL